MNPATVELVRDLRGTLCACGRGKQTGNSFCYRCYGSLPKDMQRALYRLVGDGYEAAYAAALQFLRQCGRVKGAA
jgi:hypothetical protein